MTARDNAGAFLPAPLGVKELTSGSRVALTALVVELSGAGAAAGAGAAGAAAVAAVTAGLAAGDADVPSPVSQGIG